MTTCDQCQGQLYLCDTLSGFTVCVECSRKSLAPKSKHLRVANSKDAEWELFVAAVRRVAAEHDGVVDWTHVRPLLRGRIEHKHIGLLVRQAKSRGLLVEVDHRRSEDWVGKNAGRIEPRYRIGSAA